MKICLMEACEEKDRGSIGAYYVMESCRKAGYDVDYVTEPQEGYDVEMISVHHCSDFPRLAKMKKKAAIRIVGGHPTYNNAIPIIPYADIISIGDGETLTVDLLNRLSSRLDVEAVRGIEHIIIAKDWEKGNIAPSPAFEKNLPDNPPYLNFQGTKSASWYIEIARGCPFKCAYCKLGNGMPYRYYSIEHVKKKIDLCDIKKSKKINFFAPDEASYLGYNELLDYARGKGFYTGFSSLRVDTTLRNLPNVKKNHLLRVGIDGLTQETRYKVGKKISDDMIVEYFKKYVKEGHTNFKMFMIFGYPWETLEDFNKFEILMKRILNIQNGKNIMLRIKWTPFIPQPCTPLRDSIPHYDFRMVEKIKQWHELNRHPSKLTGWYLSNDGIMSYKSHKEQCLLCAGNEDAVRNYLKTRGSD